MERAEQEVEGRFIHDGQQEVLGVLEVEAVELVEQWQGGGMAVAARLSHKWHGKW
jgi:hypothetical protein